jgi:hypothetical protein
MIASEHQLSPLLLELQDFNVFVYPERTSVELELTMLADPLFL